MDIPPRGQNFLDIYNNESDNTNKNSSGNGATAGGEENLSSTDLDDADLDSWPTAPPGAELERGRPLPNGRPPSNSAPHDQLFELNQGLGATC